MNESEIQARFFLPYYLYLNNNAYIGRNLQDLAQFIESDETKNDKPLVNEKIDRINKILL